MISIASWVRFGTQCRALDLHRFIGASPEGIRSYAVLELEKVMYWCQDQYGFSFGFRSLKGLS